MKKIVHFLALMFLYSSVLFSFSNAVEYSYDRYVQTNEVISSIANANNHEFVFPNFNNYTYADHGIELLKCFTCGSTHFYAKNFLYFKAFLTKVAPRSLINNLFIFFNNLQL